jgi:hypothetical protein
MHIVSHPEADQELEAGALWYEDRQPGLGNGFCICSFPHIPDET